MKTPFLYSQNLRGWPLNNDRYKSVLAYMAKILNDNGIQIACFQEYIFGKNDFYHHYFVNLLEDDWECITPIDYDSVVHWRSAVSVIFVRKTIYLKGETLLEFALSTRPDFADLYNYVEFTYADEESGEIVNFRLLNLHNVNRYNEGKPPKYCSKRLTLAASFWQAIHNELTNVQDQLFVVGDHNAMEGDPDYDTMLLEAHLCDTFDQKSNWKATYIDENNHSRRYDHILTNFANGYSKIQPEIFIRGFSDHCGVAYFRA